MLRTPRVKVDPTDDVWPERLQILGIRGALGQVGALGSLVGTVERRDRVRDRFDLRPNHMAGSVPRVVALVGLSSRACEPAPTIDVDASGAGGALPQSRRALRHRARGRDAMAVVWTRCQAR